jgi:hypothetical protein
MTEDTFNEMDLVMGNRANVKPPLIINQTFTGYYEDSDTMSTQDDDKTNTETRLDADETYVEGSQRGKKKRRTRTTSNELLVALKQKWEDDKEEDAVIRAEDKIAREKQLELMQRNTETSSAIADLLRIMAEKMQ